MKHEMRYRFSMITFIILLSAGPALAGPPLLTDDTGTPGDKKWEINIALTLDKHHTEATYEDRWYILPGKPINTKG